MDSSQQEKTLENLAGQPRLQTYRNSGVPPVHLYQWNAAASAEIFMILGYLEIALRNHIDRALPSSWALPGQTPKSLYSLLKTPLRTAQNTAHKLADSKGRELTHDDAVAQLSFGVWCHLIGKSNSASEHRQQDLWEIRCAAVFKEPKYENNRVALGQRLERLRKLRNRIAHHENLLQVKLTKRLHDINWVLNSLDPNYVPFVMENSRIEELISQDPRNL